MFRTITATAFVLTLTSVVSAQSRPGMVQVCTPEPRWIPASTPEYVAGYMQACSAGEPLQPVGPPVPPATQPQAAWVRADRIELGGIYHNRYSEFFKVTAIAQPASLVGLHWVIERLTMNGGQCGQLSYYPVDQAPPFGLFMASRAMVHSGCSEAISSTR